MYQYLQDDIFEKRSTASLLWLKRSIDVTGKKGSAAYYSRWRKPFRGWEAAYPETTGYIIETLFDYYHLRQEKWLREYAISCADWLLSIQSEQGYYRALTGKKDIPSIFNTGQIIFGLVRTYVETKEEKYRIAFEKSVGWLVDNLEKDGSWKIGAYVQSYIPAYYTRVIWAVLYANTIIEREDIHHEIRLAFEYNLQKVLPNYTIEDWGFEKGKPAFTHTIAYTLRGFLESSVLLNDENYTEHAEQLCKEFYKKHSNLSIPGSVDNDWNGDYRFKCLTGSFQLCIVFYRLFLITNSNRYYKFSHQIFEKNYRFQRESPSKNINGAVPGSVPFHGKYMRLKYPNWAAKFFLDAYLALKTRGNIEK